MTTSDHVCIFFADLASEPVPEAAVQPTAPPLLFSVPVASLPEHQRLRQELPPVTFEPEDAPVSDDEELEDEPVSLSSVLARQTRQLSTLHLHSSAVKEADLMARNGVIMLADGFVAKAESELSRDIADSRDPSMEKVKEALTAISVAVAAASAQLPHIAVKMLLSRANLLFNIGEPADHATWLHTMSLPTHAFFFAQPSLICRLGLCLQSVLRVCSA